MATGFIGAYTTYSTFAVETQQLVGGGRLATALLYVAASVMAGFGALWVGILLGRRAGLSRQNQGRGA